MRIEKSHRRWLGISFGLLVACALFYAYHRFFGEGSHDEPSGGSIPGLIFGGVGMAFMLIAGSLRARKFKRVRAWMTPGRTQAWMRAHLWLGSLSLFIILLHAGFRFGGLLTTIIMVLLYLVVISGWIGATLQHFLPTAMTEDAPGETIFEQIPHVLKALDTEAAEVVAVCGPLDGESLEVWRARHLDVIKSLEGNQQEKRQGKKLLTTDYRNELVAGIKAAPLPGSEPLKSFYVQEIQPFLHGRQNRTSILTNSTRAEILFAQKRLLIPETLHRTLDHLKRICKDRRDLIRQRKMHHWLHGWLYFHVPLSYVLLALAIAHAIMSFKYAAIKPI